MTSTVKDFKNRVDAITEIAGFPFADTKFLINIINTVTLYLKTLRKNTA